MKKFAENIRFLTAVLLLLFSGMLTSCNSLDKISDGGLSVSVVKSQVAYNKGQQFVGVQCDGDWAIALVFDGEDAWASLDVTSGVGDKANVRLSYQENITGHSRDLKIVLDNGSNWAECTFTQLSKEESVIPPPSPSKNSDPRRHKWMELPAMDNPDLGYYYHSFSMNGKTYRNYAFGWSQKDRVAIWVAYPLSRLYTNGDAGRTNAWELDPLLGSYSSAPFGGYGGDYARGHQLPSADRQCNDTANEQTFYGTNMTPQLDEHNEGIWAALEGKVRSIANGSDTTYVVTGVVVSPSSKTSRDSYGNSVTVPDAYFKALLYYNRYSTIGQWKAAAFYLEHRQYTGGVQKEHSMSIDKLEQKSGLDFFVNLPEKIGQNQAAAIEAEDPTNVSLWW